MPHHDRYINQTLPHLGIKLSWCLIYFQNVPISSSENLIQIPQRISRCLQWFHLGYLHDLLAIWSSVWAGLLGVDNVFLLHAGLNVCHQTRLRDRTPVPIGEKGISNRSFKVSACSSDAEGQNVEGLCFLGWMMRKVKNAC